MPKMLDEVPDDEYVSVIRTLEYRGPAWWVKQTLSKGLKMPFEAPNGTIIERDRTVETLDA